MFELNGKHNHAKVFTDDLESGAMSQIIELCNQPFSEGLSIRIMPDAHQGAGCTIGTTMTIQDKIVPNLVGVDIGCGLDVAIVNIDKDQINFDQLDDVIRKHIPSGFSIRSKESSLAGSVRIQDVIAPINEHRAKLSIGTLGGGNHFLEVNEIDDEHVAVVVHSGSRNLGKQIAEHYQLTAYEELMESKNNRAEIIQKLKKEGREKEIETVLKSLPKQKVHKELAYLEGNSFKNYLHDMAIAQHFALTNRKAMIHEILTHMNWSAIDTFTTIHNYIDIENMILRKGAISAQKGERVIIPMNMRDGSLIAFGKGNPDWNYSAPHGAGRLMSRSKAKESLLVEDFEKTMESVWSTSVGQSTLDESPMAYKPMDDIVRHTWGTVEVAQVIKPLYNFKAN